MKSANQVREYVRRRWMQESAKASSSATSQAKFEAFLEVLNAFDETKALEMPGEGKPSNEKAETSPTCDVQQPTTNETPRTDEKCLGTLISQVDANFARELERENISLRNAQKICGDCDAPTLEQYKNGLKAANVELMSEKERRVIAQEACVKYDALIRELLTYNLPGDMHEKLMRVAEPSNTQLSGGTSAPTES